jgi:branched-chain amino acid transport system substrate-binding protein
MVLVASACSGLGGGGGPSSVKIVSSLPMTGPSRTQTLTIINSIKMALEEVGNKVGSTTIEYEAFDDATAAKQSWDAAQEAENARKAIDDSKIVAYIGTYNSGAAKVAIPLLCKANMVMVSPANTYVGLTKSIPPISAANEPGTYYPDGCKHNYFRVVPSDKIQGDADANWAKELGAKKIYITHDDELYGKGLADGFRLKVKELGITEVGYEAAPKADNFRALINKVKDSGADMLYSGSIVDNNTSVMLKNLREIDPTGKIKFLTGDGNLCGEFLKEAGSAGEGAYGTFGGTAPEAYTGAAKDWLTKYKAKFGGDDPDVYAIYGYEAAKVVIAALQKAGDKANDRATVRDNVAGTKDFQGVLGKWSFDKDGDTSLTQISAFIAKSGKWSFQKVLGQ